MNDLQQLLRTVGTEIISPVYLVGGCVRDSLRQAPVNDYDFATPHKVEDVEAAIKASGRRAFQIGNSKRHGTISCKLGRQDGTSQEIQITTFRTERYEEGSRQPITTYTDSLEEDLSRRDFTMNAIALGETGLIDPFKGQADITNGWISPVGDPCERFQEDPLRILRAVRFQSTLGFDLAPSISDAIMSERSRLLTISKERWVLELDKLLMGVNAGTALTSMLEYGLFSIMLPELTFRFKTFDPWYGRELSTIQQRWSVLLGDNIQAPYAVTFGSSKKHVNLYKQDMLKKICGHLKFSKMRTKWILESWAP